MSDELIIYLDGEYVKKSEAKVSVFDHGLLYGDGVFEGIRAYNGCIFKCKEHIDRIYAAAKAIMLEIPMTKEEMKEILLETCRKNNIKDKGEKNERLLQERVQLDNGQRNGARDLRRQRQTLRSFRTAERSYI